MFEVDSPEVLQDRPGAKWQRYGKDVLAMWVADMDFPVAAPIFEAMRDVIAVGDLGYPMPYLAADIRQGFADRMQGMYDWSIDPEDVILTQDVIQAIQFVLRTCLDDGAGVAIQTPIYPPFLASLETTNCRLVDNPWIRDGDTWALDVEGLEQSCRAGEVQALLLCNPHNPMGRVMRRQELEELARLAVEHDLLILCDEIHAEILHPGVWHIPIASLGPAVAERTVTFSSASKPFNLAALRLAQMHTTSSRIRAGLEELPNHSVGGLNIFGLTATKTAWAECDDWIEAMRSLITTNRDLLAELLAEHIPEMDYVKPEATYLGWLDGTALGLGDEVSKFFLDNARVVGNRGLDFGEHGAGCMRLNFATSPEIIERAVEQMAAALAQSRG